MYFILKGADFSSANLGQITVVEGTIGTGGSGDSSTTTYTLTVNPTPSTATVTLTATGFTQEGNSITVTSGTKVSYVVEATGYVSKSGDWYVYSNTTKTVTLNAEGSTAVTYTLTINPTPSDAIVTIDGVVRNSMTVEENNSVDWSVSKTGYVTQSDVWIATENKTLNITLEAESGSGGGLPDGYTALPTTKYALGVTSSGTGRVSSNNAKRFSTANDTVANGILIPNGKTLHLIGLASGTYPLRLDYIYCTGNVKCPVSGSTTAIEGLVGTCSNYNSSNYFPLNKDGADTIDITNSYGADYYFWFGFAGLTLNESILNAYDTYTLAYKID